jgi:hypothetical protein
MSGPSPVFRFGGPAVLADLCQWAKHGLGDVRDKIQCDGPFDTFVCCRYQSVDADRLKNILTERLPVARLRVYLNADLFRHRPHIIAARYE